MPKISMEFEAAEDLRMLMERKGADELSNHELLATIVKRGPSVCGFMVKSLISELTPETYEQVKTNIGKYRGLASK